MKALWTIVVITALVFVTIVAQYGRMDGGYYDGKGSLEKKLIEEDHDAWNRCLRTRLRDVQVPLS